MLDHKTDPAKLPTLGRIFLWVGMMFAPQDHFAKMTAPDRVGAWRWGLCVLHTLKIMQSYHQTVALQKRPPWGGRALSFLQNDGWVRLALPVNFQGECDVR